MQPTLMSYTFNGPPGPVLLDVQSVKPDAILLLDTFFHVIVWHGEVISTWREAGYQELPEHALFRSMLQQPKDDAQVGGSGAWVGPPGAAACASVHPGLVLPVPLCAPPFTLQPM